MLSRTTTSIVTFVHPFVVAGYTDKLPPGSYELFVEDEVIQSHSFTAYRRTSTHLLIKWKIGGSELRLLDPGKLAMALTQDQIDTTNGENNKNGEAALSPSKD